MYDYKNSARALLIEITLMSMLAYCLLYKVLLPYSYFSIIIVSAVVLALSIIHDGSNKLVVFQIILVYLVIRWVYYLSTSNVIFFGDTFWDYGTSRMFAQANSVFVVPITSSPTIGGQGLLTWYSGFPLLHTLCLSFSLVTGIDLYYLNLIIPSILSTISFAFVYLLVEKLRKSLQVEYKTGLLALVVYGTVSSLVFNQMQLIRQNLGIVFFTAILYLICVLITERARAGNASYQTIVVLFLLSCCLAHHFTSWTLISYLAIFLVLSTVGIYMLKIRRPCFSYRTNTSLLLLTLLGLIFMFAWWTNWAGFIMETANVKIRGLLGILSGLPAIRLYVPLAVYPKSLQQAYLLSILQLRDVVLYVFTGLGFCFLWFRRTKAPASERVRTFLVYSLLALGVVFVIDVAFLNLEPERVFALALPLVAFSAAIPFREIQNRWGAGSLWKAGICAFTILFVFSAFIGLWAHNFVPIHLYDPSISRGEIGEISSDYMRLKPFFDSKVCYEHLRTIWADDINPLAYLLDPSQYAKIKTLPSENWQTQVGQAKGEVVCSFHDLNMYTYYSNIYSVIRTPQEATHVQDGLRQYLDNGLNRVYDDSSSQLFETP